MSPLPHLNGFEQLPPHKRKQIWGVLMKIMRYNKDDSFHPWATRRSRRRGIRRSIRTLRLSARSPP